MYLIANKRLRYGVMLLQIGEMIYSWWPSLEVSDYAGFVCSFAFDRFVSDG
jgi:hypothetical protein